MDITLGRKTSTPQDPRHPSVQPVVTTGVRATAIAGAEHVPGGSDAHRPNRTPGVSPSKRGR